MPEDGSLHVKAAETLVLFQPLAFAAGLRDPVIPGGVESSLIVTEPAPALPTLSAAEEGLTTPSDVVSVGTESLAGLGFSATPEPPSVAAHTMPTGAVLIQPAAFGVRLSVAVTTGAVLSRV